MADLGSKIAQEYCPDDAFVLELKDIDGTLLLNDGDDTPMTVSILGADSDVAVAARHNSSNRRIQAGPRAKLTSEGFTSDQASYLAKLTVGWNITMGGEKPTFSQDAARKLYNDRKLAFIREQVEAAIEDRANFLKG